MSPVAPEIAVPVLVFEAPPPIRDTLSDDSPNAALRYLALREAHPLVQDEIGMVDLHLDGFRMIDWNDEAELEPTAYQAFLIEHQGFLESMAQASQIAHYNMQTDAAGYYGVVEREGPRVGMVGWMGNVRRLIRDDAIRAWVAGDHGAALDRVETMVRIARQLPRTSHAHSLDLLLASSWAGVALDLLDSMASHPSATGADRGRMRQIVALFDGPDPLDHFAAMRNTIASYDLFVSSELRETEGGAALWHMIGQVHAVDLVIDQIMKPMREAAAMLDGETDSTPSETYNHTMQTDAMIDAIIQQLDGLTVEDLRRSYRHAHPFVRIAIEELAKDDPELDVFRQIKEKLESDETGIPEILHLTVLRSYVHSHQRILRQRDDLHANLRD
jgi:hypothetical protein